MRRRRWRRVGRGFTQLARAERFSRVKICLFFKLSRCAWSQVRCYSIEVTEMICSLGWFPYLTSLWNAKFQYKIKWLSATIFKNCKQIQGISCEKYYTKVSLNLTQFLYYGKVNKWLALLSFRYDHDTMSETGKYSLCHIYLFKSP